MSEHGDKFKIVLIALIAVFVVFLCITLIFDLSETKKVYNGAAEVEDIPSLEIVKGSGSININTASADELESLPGIGSVKAQNIISFREINGDFISITQLKLVDGIGDEIYNNIKDLITIG